MSTWSLNIFFILLITYQNIYLAKTKHPSSLPISFSVDCAIFTRNFLSSFSFRRAQASLCEFYDLMSRKTISRVIFTFASAFTLPRHIKLIFEKKPEREAKEKAESKLQFKVFSNEQSEPFSSLSLSDFAFTRCFTSHYIVDVRRRRIIYRAPHPLNDIS